MAELTFGFSDSEDRLWLKSSEGATYWLTRRLLARFIGPTAALLAKTVPGSEVPNALPPAQHVALEHAEAVADTPEGQPAMVRNKETRAPDGGAHSPPRLVTGLSVSADAIRCRLSIVAGGRDSLLDMSRLDFHRFLAAMVLAAGKSNWNLPDIPDWLSAEG